MKEKTMLKIIDAVWTCTLLVMILLAVAVTVKEEPKSLLDQLAEEGTPFFIDADGELFVGDDFDKIKEWYANK